MNPDEILVGSLALFFALVSFLIGVGRWSAPYQLRTFQAVAKRHGKTAARGVWLLISLAFFLVGVAVLLGFRPSYARLSVGHYGSWGDFRGTPPEILENSFPWTQTLQIQAPHMLV